VASSVDMITIIIHGKLQRICIKIMKTKLSTNLDNTEATVFSQAGVAISEKN
jgi:hypothetical protein